MEMIGGWSHTTPQLAFKATFGYLDVQKDRTPPLPELTVELRLPERFDRLSVHSPSSGMTGVLERDGLLHRLRLRDVPLYGVALLKAG